ncbi:MULTISPECIES: MerR family transcriptional regulator [unclassified Massilia]|uniref:MerR family transcriptional regulator n=1 Tax=unclassified Massilia TaxID=2609279 RepID=UPI001B834674|nr:MULTISPECIES: MerR family transcriptional regulator [unclassified Massilia]MBQ5941869.1 MerR family transcriptional regulator [Massilia sp. AB1]MBQ5965727.1 MerR family transcriptional regulator [Massilia sp. ZL223]
MLKVGELAALAHLTVRTLHHYDSIGLLRPSARSDAGYRLYDRDDVARLQQIQALRVLGMSLADIGLYLDSPDASPLAVVERQLAAVDRQILDATQMRRQLLRLRGELVRGAKPELSDWLTTLETMTVYEQYFTKDELEQLPFFSNPDAQADWRQLVEQGTGLMRSQVPPASSAAKSFAQRWLDAFQRDTAHNDAFASRINLMAAREQQAMQEQFGVSPELMGYVMASIGELRRDVYARYLAPEVLERMARHQAEHGHEWPGLIGAVREQMGSDPDARGPEARALARRWMSMFQDMVGTDPVAVEAFRRASASEPVLRMGSGIGDDMLDYLRKAMSPPPDMERSTRSA